MGSSNAFFTQISKQPRSNRFYLLYFLWLAFQLSAMLLVIGLIIPADLFEKIWLGHGRWLVVLALFAAFMQQKIWTTVIQVGESSRKTKHIQLLNLLVAVCYLFFVFLIISVGETSVFAVLQLIIIQYLIATAIASWSLYTSTNGASEKDEKSSETINEFITYCKPLIILGAVGFLYTFTSNWMLHKYAGSIGQGYFQIASQFANVSLLATASILNIFWKEVAEATANLDKLAVERLYKKVNRGLVIFNTTISGFLLPWSKQIVLLFLGSNYIDAWPILAIMFLYPIHQSMGQIGATMFLAQGETRRYTVLSIGVLLCIAIPITYFALAPVNGFLLPGLGLGALGMAISTVLANFIGVSAQAVMISKIGGWKLDWMYQLVGIPIIISSGYFSKFFVEIFFNFDHPIISEMICPIIITGVIYSALILCILWFLPWLIGMDRVEMKNLLKNFNPVHGKS